MKKHSLFASDQRKDKEEEKTSKTTKSYYESSTSREYEVDFIQGHKLKTDGEHLEFFVKWKNYKEDDNTWEAFELFSQDAPELA